MQNDHSYARAFCPVAERRCAASVKRCTRRLVSPDGGELAKLLNNRDTLRVFS
jgi:hypothetical protein